MTTKVSVHQGGSNNYKFMHPTLKQLNIHVQQILIDLKGKIDNNTIIVGYLNTSFSTIDRFFREKINKKILDLSYTLGEIHLTGKQNISLDRGTHSSQSYTKHLPR